MCDKVHVGQHARRNAGPQVASGPIRSVLLAVCLALTASGCQTDGRTDAGGRPMSVSDWKPISITESDVNIPLHVPVTITRLEHRTRDNSFPMQRYLLEGGKGQIYQQRVTGAFFNESTEARMKSQEEFVKAVENAFKNDLVGLLPPKEVRLKKRLAGYWTTVRVVRGRCHFARVGYRLGDLTGYDNDRGSMDTIVSLRYCGDDAAFDDFLPMFEKMDLIDDREAYRAAIYPANTSGKSP